MSVWLPLLVLFTTIITPPPSSTVTVSVADAHGRPLSRVQVSLFLYDIQGRSLKTQYAGSCQTDAQGVCTIPVPAGAPRDASGFYRGYLSVGHYGRRSMLWPGGDISVAVWLDSSGTRLDIPHHGAYNEAPPETLATGRWRGMALLVGLGFIGTVLWYWRHRRARV